MMTSGVRRYADTHDRYNEMIKDDKVGKVLVVCPICHGTGEESAGALSVRNCRLCGGKKTALCIPVSGVDNVGITLDTH